MNTTMWLDLLNEGIPLLLLIALGMALYRGLKKNHCAPCGERGSVETLPHLSGENNSIHG